MKGRLFPSNIDTSILTQNNEIYIPPEVWVELNELYSKEEIKQKISDAMDSIPLPYRQISIRDAIDSFNSMKNSLDIVDGDWFTRYDYKYQLTHKYFPTDRLGNQSSDYFHQVNRWMCDSINSPSPYRTWKTEKFRLTLLNALWTLKVDKINNATMRMLIGMRKYIASQFRPSTAKTVYDYFGAKDVLDFSSGWGDRLAGFCASNAKSYFGVDPNHNLIDDYNKQVELYGKGKDITLVCDCAEDVDYGDREFDTIFTSPPYFNIERYTQDDNQSFKRYKKIDAWLELFLYKSLKNAWTHLKKDGIMIINISDVYSNHTINKICDPMNDYISTLPNAEYVGCYGYQMNKRPNSKAHKIGVFCEPMWVWRKNE